MLQLDIYYVHYSKMHLPPNPKRKYEREDVLYYSVLLRKKLCRHLHQHLLKAAYRFYASDVTVNVLKVSLTCYDIRIKEFC